MESSLVSRLACGLPSERFLREYRCTGSQAQTQGFFDRLKRMEIVGRRLTGFGSLARQNLEC